MKTLHILFGFFFFLATLLSAQAHAEAQMFFVHTDHLGTPAVMTDMNQNVVWERQQTPFGETVTQTDTTIQPQRFPGQYEDSETGYYYNYFRDYDPSIGRYLQSDPIGLRGGLNTYGYVYQNPLSYTDPRGLAVCGGFCVGGLAYLLFELSLSAWDAYDTYDTVTDPCSTTGEKVAAGGLFAAGVFLPGNYGWADNAVKKVKDLKPLHSPDVVGDRPDLRNLSDNELIEAVTNPKNNDPLKVNTNTGNVVDGNSRAYELQRRAADPNSSITPDTQIPVQNYTPDNSMFWDM